LLFTANGDNSVIKKGGVKLKALHEVIEPDFTVLKMKGFKGHFYHWHKRMEMVYMTNGKCVLEISNNKYIMKKGDVAFIQSGEVHLLSSSEEDDAVAYICTFNPSVLQHIKAEIVPINNYISMDLMKKAGIDKEIEKYFEEAFFEITNKDIMSDNIILSDLIRLYSIFARNFQKEEGFLGKNNFSYAAFRDAVEYISENYTDDITLNTLAEKMNYCSSYISTMFVTYTGVNFKTYLDTIRIKHAADMLKNSDDKIADIAFECGFNNLKTFNNTFKRITHKLPSEFRHKASDY